MAFLGFKKDIMHKFTIDQRFQGRLFYASLWIFFIEITIIAIILKTVIFDNGNFIIIISSWQVFGTRFILGLFLHMELIEDVNQGLKMLDYLNTHP